MDGDDLVCNFKKCRKTLRDVAYVTACSHVFCDEHGTKEFNKAKVCPACETNLSVKFEIVRNNLQPSDQYKSMILAGLKPDVISEICSRALSFWVYQSHQEKTYQVYQANKAKERANQLEQYYEQIVSRTSSELNNLKLQVSAGKKEIDDTKKKYNEISDKLMEKTRQHQKLQSMYDCMRRKYITMSTFDTGEPTTPSCVYNAAANIPANMSRSGDGPSSYGSNANHQAFDPRRNRVSQSPHSFLFDPQTDPTNHVQSEFSVNLGTPRR